METIKLGSIESLIVVIVDRLNGIDDLNDVTGLVFSVALKSDPSTFIESNRPCAIDTINPMRALCEIDTTQIVYSATEDMEYGLYVKYTSGSESPILGPTRFRVTVD